MEGMGKGRKRKGKEGREEGKGGEGRRELKKRGGRRKRRRRGEGREVECGNVKRREA